MVLDHKTPMQVGGLNVKENLALACRPCKIKKGLMTVEEFEAYLEALLNDPIEKFRRQARLGQSVSTTSALLRLPWKWRPAVSKA